MGRNEGVHLPVGGTRTGALKEEWPSSLSRQMAAVAQLRGEKRNPSQVLDHQGPSYAGGGAFLWP